jgi:hypothetical protein
VIIRLVLAADENPLLEANQARLASAKLLDCHPAGAGESFFSTLSCSLNIPEMLLKSN